MSNFKKKHGKLLIIGLLNFDHNKGDSKHFKMLKEFLMEDFDLFSISIGSGRSFNDIKIGYPSNSILRQVYWTLILSYYIIKLKLKENVEVLYFRPMGAIVIPFIVAKLLRFKIVAEINGIVAEGYSDNKLLARVLKYCYQFIFNKAEFISASKGYAKYISITYGVDRKKILELTLGYHKLLRHSSQFESLEYLNLKIKNYFLFIGNITEYQGLQYIIKAVAKYKSELSSIKILIVGDGVYKERLVELVNENNIMELVEFKPRVDKEMLHYYLSINAVGLSPFDKNRGMVASISGLKTYDYLFYRMPILTSKMDDAAEFIENNNLGLVIREFTDEEIFSLINITLGTDYKKVVNKSYERIYKKIEAIYNWENRFKKIRDKLKEVV